MTDLTHSDPCLIHAYRQWQAPLEQGSALYNASKMAQAIIALTDATRISASFHPLFHYLESGLNTELAEIYAANNQWQEACTAYERAVFLHHDNTTAIAGKTNAETKQPNTAERYRTIGLSIKLRPENYQLNGIYALRKQARTASPLESITLYQQAIAECEATHLRYHQLAALPWLMRAQCFAAQGEDALARNDIRHGMDLDRANTDLLQLSVSLAA
ncbi:MAG: hypothetical protein MK052_02600 [Alphaproteobacteria bacterium]|nr:hypothetical protein [Alphaproteobacteria bacterium]